MTANRGQKSKIGGIWYTVYSIQYPVDSQYQIEDIIIMWKVVKVVTKTGGQSQVHLLLGLHCGFGRGRTPSTCCPCGMMPDPR